MTPPPGEVLRSRPYIRLLVLAAALGVPISAVSYGFLALIQWLETLLYHKLPAGLGLSPVPAWWPVPLLVVAGLLVGATIRYLPGQAGHVPAEGFHTGGAPTAAELPGIVLAALAGLALGVVLGPEAPLIALGGGLAALSLRLSRRKVSAEGQATVAAAGSFAAISALLGSPLLGAFMLMEASGLGGATMGLVLIPGLLAAGVGSLIFIGLGHWTGLGPLALEIPGLSTVGPPTLAQFGWALVIGVAAALVGTGIRRGALTLEVRTRRWTILPVVLTGLVVGLIAMAYQLITDRPATDVLFSGQTAIGPLLRDGPGTTVSVLLILLVLKAIAYTVSLATFRGGPIFPSLFLGAAGGIALSHLPGLPPIAGAAMGMGAMSAVMLRLPLTSVLLATLLLLQDGLALMPLVIVTVVCAHVTAAHLEGRPNTAIPVDGS